MTQIGHRISDALEPTATTDVELPVTTASTAKGTIVVRALKAGGRKMHFDTDEETTARMYGAHLAGFTTDVLTTAVMEWNESEGTDWPSVGDMKMIASTIVRDRREAEEAKRDHTDCEECDGVHWVRVQGRTITMLVGKDKTPTEVETTYMRPCEQCLPERYRIMVTENHQTTCADKPYGCSVCGVYRGAGSKKKGH